MPIARRRRCRLWIALALLPLGAGAQPAGPLEDYQPNGDYLIEIDGKPDPGAEIFFSRRFASYLILTPALPSPVLIIPGSQSVRSVHILKVAKQSDGSYDLLPGALLDELGRFDRAGAEVRFSAHGKSITFKEKPPLLGVQSLAALVAYAKTYGELARAYTPASDAVQALRAAGRDVKVIVYFGSWCPFCQRYVPRLLGVAQDLGAGGIQFEFYGLPRAIGNDPVSKAQRIDSVPTGIVVRGGKEIGRLRGDEWMAPEKALQRALAAPGSS